MLHICLRKAVKRERVLALVSRHKERKYGNFFFLATLACSLLLPPPFVSLLCVKVEQTQSKRYERCLEQTFPCFCGVDCVVYYNGKTPFCCKWRLLKSWQLQKQPPPPLFTATKGGNWIVIMKQEQLLLAEMRPRKSLVGIAGVSRGLIREE